MYLQIARLALISESESRVNLYESTISAGIMGRATVLQAEQTSNIRGNEVYHLALRRGKDGEEAGTERDR